MEKTILLIVVCLLICTPLAQAKKHHISDTEQEAGIASDANGIPCTFGPALWHYIFM